jgi:type IV pilus assembly protein PilE
MERPRGFTLLEVIIVVAIVAILTALAVSAYGRYVLRSHRAEAHQALMALADGEERWYATYNRYTDDLSQFGFTEPAASLNGHYELVLAVDEETAQSFTAIAIPIHTQAADVCGSLSINNRGNKLPDSADAQANTNGKCW